MRRVLALAALACALPVSAHDLLTAQAVEQHLRDAERWRAASAPSKLTAFWPIHG